LESAVSLERSTSIRRTSLAEVSKEMGHGSSEITYRTYYKWLPKESRTDVDALDDPRPSATCTQPDEKNEASS
jgi:hypothetical protein